MPAASKQPAMQSRHRQPLDHPSPARSVKSRGFGVLHGLRHSPSHSRCMILFPSQQSCNATGLTTSWKCGVTMCCKDSKKRWALGCMNSYCRERGITQPRPPITIHMTIPVCSLVRGVATLTTNKQRGLKLFCLELPHLCSSAHKIGTFTLS